MELEMELDSEKSSISDLSPNTVLPHRRCSEVEKRSVNGKLTRKDDILRVKESFTEISFRRYRSSSCKNALSRPVGSEGYIEPKRGSMYQSSREVRRMKEMGCNEGRRKIELSRASDTSFSFRIVDSLHCLDEETMQKRSPASSVSSNLNPKSVRRPCIEPCSSDDFTEICPNLDKRDKHSAGVVGSDSIGNPNFKCEQVVGPLNDGNELLERDTALTFQKSLSAKVEIPCSPSSSGSYLSNGASSKSRFSPMRMMFDPFTKSKSLRSPLGHVPEPGDAKTTGMSNMRRNQTFRKYLFHDFSHTDQKVDFDSQIAQKDHHHSAVACSPVHLHGRLKLENKHGVPFFEFSLDFPEEVLVAKTWKTNNAFNWVYTFHSISSRKKSNATGWGLTDGNKESLVVGQMQVSCHLCSKLKDGGDFDNSMVTEFVMYDIAHARHRVSTEDSPDVRPDSSANPGLVGGSHEMGGNSDAVKHQPKYAFDRGHFDSSNPYPRASAVLHPDLEIAAVVIQLPFAKRESLKYKRGDRGSDEMHSNLLNLSVGEQRRKTIPDKENAENVKVVIPTGNHSLPNGDSQGPSSLLDRWRSGGGCDCGGWDMACPLTVFGNPGIQCAEDEPLLDNQQPLELFLMGTKENIPALTMTVLEEGQYAVDFHAQLSTLQAFSICVAILHGTEATGVTREERGNQLSHCNSLKMLIEEEVKFLIETVTEEEKRKASKKVEGIRQSYVLNPPFSPISRV
ncbi:uncharacterized protein [Populus alba]|uniref:Uncharacterized protein n=1 Tax=Populus alba TaxID=43335 RepID=A0A4U5PKL3_POPAL|nr:uncharacterized protein LOC118033695 [Populus alba]XP_034894673.1 uncharacterized protein LOC118033695 [Populus alba]XP_034894674.1 uncharacterized protein LOC118033695 [Populus alba]TKR97497.1 hypothetical protein D5086_0000211420 [Populus alba]